MYFKLTKVSAFHSGLKLYEKRSFFNFFAGGALIGAFRYGASGRDMPQLEMAAAFVMYSLLLNSLDAPAPLA
jgi:hypothetical protein